MLLELQSCKPSWNVSLTREQVYACSWGRLMIVGPSIQWLYPGLQTSLLCCHEMHIAYAAQMRTTGIRTSPLSPGL